ncbi:adenosylcobinamide-phosphate synthase CbiB [Chitinimonas sp.]|uniref:adenosylcobinamide-phosphate synthase CbiB n=1 Tax=Chitinimonas sp. TaxID=1934313 RepID=UPI002F937107
MLELAPGPWLAALLGGLVLEALWGEPRRWHPLVGFGRLAQMLERRSNSGRQPLLRGTLAWVLLLGGCLGVYGLLEQALPASYAWLLDAWAFWFALGAHSLHSHVVAILRPLRAGDLPLARQQLARIVSRDCSALDRAGISKATLESTLENGSDAIFATLFWFALLGGYGALLHRLANTLDAMWGYRSPQFLYFGRCAARADDVLNWLPARLTALSYTLLGQSRLAWHCWQQQGPLWDSPNAGPVMAAGAGALSVELGGDACYHGQREARPRLGAGASPGSHDVLRGLRLVQRSVLLWLVVLVGLGSARWLL